MEKGIVMDELTRGKLDAVLVDALTGSRDSISEAIQQRKDQIYDDMSVGEKFADLVTRGQRYGGPNREIYDDPPELIGQRIPSYEDRRRENDPRYQELFKMREEYQSEVEKNSGSGLMSLLRGAGDMMLGEDIMDNLPMLIRALQNTNKDTLTMEQMRDMSGPVDESSLSVRLSNTPGLSEKISDDVAMALGMAMPSPAGKGKGLGSLFDMLGDSMDPKKIKESLSKIYQDLEKPKTGREGFDDLVQEARDDYMDSPEALEKALRAQRDAIRKAKRDGDMMATGGRPGLYANINAKRKRIEAGSGETMRKAGSKGAPTKENFRRAATTAKKAMGGGLSLAKGYYGKSYK